ncbi:MAG: glycoside hydrolase family 16 protein [Chitinophagaceae bacterium]
MKHLVHFSSLAASLLLFSACKKSGDAAPDPVPPADTVVHTPIVPPISYTGYELTWSDEFNNAGIDMTKWNLETGTGVNGDFGTGQLDRATNRTENAKIMQGITGSGGGCLAITTLKETYLDRNYTSARLTTQGKGSWGPGTRIEARIWPRDVLYKGQGFAFWMMPAEIPAGQTSIMWPQGGEIDITEFIGTIPFHNLGSVHYAWSWENNQYQSWNHGHKGGYYNFNDQEVPAANPDYGQWPVAAGNAAAGSGGFHTYRIDWFADRLEFAVDQNVYHIHYFRDGAAFDGGVADGQDADAKVTIAGKRVMKSEYSNHFTEWSPFEHKFFLMLTAGVGGRDDMTYGGAIVPEARFPCTTLIDWVRVYRRI